MAKKSQQKGMEEHKRRFEYFDGDDFDMRLMLVGKSGSGKSSVGNTILGRDYFPVRSGFAAGNKKCYLQMTERREKQIRVVDTCGIFDTYRPQEKIKIEAAKALTMCAPGPHAFLLVMPFERYTCENQEMVSILESMFPGFFKYAIVVFTKADDLQGKPQEEAVKDANPELKELLQKVQRRFIFVNNREPIPAKKTEVVLDLLDMAYGLYEINGKTCFTSEHFKKAEQMALSRDEEIKQEAKEKAGSPNADIISILLDKIKKMEEEMMVYSHIAKEHHAILQTLTDRTKKEKGQEKAEKNLLRAVNVKEVEQDRRNSALKLLDPFALSVFANTFSEKKHCN